MIHKILITFLFIACPHLNANLFERYPNEFGPLPAQANTVEITPEFKRPGASISSPSIEAEHARNRSFDLLRRQKKIMDELWELDSYVPTPEPDFRQDYISLQMQGDFNHLKRLKRELKHELKHAWFDREFLQEKINFINSLLEAPLTKSLAIIKNGTLKKACTELRKLEIQFGCAPDIILTDPRIIHQLSQERKACGFDCVEAAQTIFKNRRDYPHFLEQERKRELEEKANQIIHQKYALDTETIAFLNHQEINSNAFLDFYGNAVQQAIHQQFVDIVTAASDIHLQNLENSTVQKYAKTTVECADIGREYNKQGFNQEALCVSNFCWKLVHYTKEIAIGTCTGISDGITQTIEMIRHPIHTITGIAESAAYVALGYLYIMMEATDVEMRFELSAEMGEKKAQEIGARFRPVHEAGKQKLAELTARDCSHLASSAITQILLQKQLLKATGRFFKLAEKELLRIAEKIAPALQEEEVALAIADGEIVEIAGGPGDDGSIAQSLRSSTESVEIPEPTINQSTIAILKDGYYEVNGFKFTERYYNRLWQEGRQAPTFRASSILEHAQDITTDKFKKGFFRYEFDGWEMIYNPISKEIWHLGPIKPKKVIK